MWLVGVAPRGAMPAAAQAQQGSLLLRTGNRDAQAVVVVVTLSQWCRRGGVDQDAFDLIVAERAGVDAVPTGRLGAFWQQLHGADTIAADGGQQIEGRSGAGLEARGQSLANGGAVG